MVIIDHKGDLHPQIVIEDENGKSVDVQYLPERAMIKVKKAT
jgi:DNA-directed RNA polymerase subunit beta'